MGHIFNLFINVIKLIFGKLTEQGNSIQSLQIQMGEPVVLDGIGGKLSLGGFPWIL